MNPLRIITPSFIALILASCASHHTDSYDTPTSAEAAAEAGNQEINPVYDTPAAYEETTHSPATKPIVETTTKPAASPQPSVSAAVKPTKPASSGAAVTHTVVAGDTLSGISSKYKVSSAAIKQANGMTKDTVILGKKMMIPAAR
jgi:LysM repeat protein